MRIPLARKRNIYWLLAPVVTAILAGLGSVTYAQGSLLAAPGAAGA